MCVCLSGFSHFVPNSINSLLRRMFYVQMCSIYNKKNNDINLTYKLFINMYEIQGIFLYAYVYDYNLMMEKFASNYYYNLEVLGEV